MTVGVAVAAVIFGLVLGLLGAAAKLSSSSLALKLANAYTTAIRGIPEILVLLIVFYGGTIALSDLAATLGWAEHVDVNAFSAGVFGLGLVFGAYATEVFRGAFLAVPKGQIEAARACGMSAWQVFHRVQFPQVLRFALPGLGNLWLNLLKDTSLISVIGLEELMRKTAFAVGGTKLPFTFYGAAAVIFLGLTVVSMVVLQTAERRANRGIRRA